jgi:predicted amidohydrolase YtcJ
VSAHPPEPSDTDPLVQEIRRRRDRRLGVIQIGALADFAILNDDILSMKPDDLPNTWVAYTYVGGKQVWPAAGR